MMLDGVQRGEMKQVIGPDRKGPEELRDAEFAKRAKRLDDRERDQAIRESELEKKRADAEKLHNSAVLALQKIPELKDEAEGRGYEEGFASGKADAEASCAEQLKADRDALENQLALQKLKIDEAAQKSRDEFELALDRLKAKQKEAASLKERTQQKQLAVEVGLEAIARGDIVSGEKGATPDKHLIGFRPDLDDTAKQSLKIRIGPAWNWLSEQAERVSHIVANRINLAEKRLARREREASNSLVRSAAKDVEIRQKEAKLQTLIDRTSTLWTRLNSYLEPVLSWKREFDAADVQRKSVLAKDPRSTIVDTALTDSRVKDATDVGDEVESLFASFAAYQRNLKGR